MAEQKIELRKVRDFGLNINDTFLFIKQNLKPLLLSFIAICGIFMLGQAVFSGLYQSRAFGVFDQIINRRANTYNSLPQQTLSDIFNLQYFLLLAFIYGTYVAMQVAVGAYIKYYLDFDGEQATIEDVWRLFRKYYFKIFFYSFPIAILIFIGCIFCVLPGIYLAIVLTPFTCIVIMEDLSFGASFNRCFEIIKNNFWISVAIYLVAYLIYSISSTIIGLVVTGFAGLAAYFTTRSIGTTAGIVTSFFNIFAHFFYIIYSVATTLHYFTLAEQRDGTGMLNRIDSIGTQKGDFDNIEEQY